MVFISASTFAAVNECKGKISNQVMTVNIEHNVDTSNSMYSVNISAKNEWQGRKLLVISIESINASELTMNLDTIKGNPNNGNDFTDTNYSYAFFLASDKWLKGQYCILAQYTDNGEPGFYYAASILKLNKALKAQPSAAGTPQSGAP